MADTFASLKRRIDRFSHEMTDDALGHAIGKMAKDEGVSAASADLGGDPKFSGWAPKLLLRYDIVDRGKVLVYPTRSAAGPWTVAEFGRNASQGPRLRSSRLTATGRRRSAKSMRRWNGVTPAFNTATTTVDQIEKKAPGLVETQVGRAAAKAFRL